jgi:hypothetical protein
MVKPNSVFILLRSDGVDYQVTGYSYDTLSPGYMAILLPLPLVKMFGNASYFHRERKLVFALAL